FEAVPIQAGAIEATRVMNDDFQSSEDLAFVAEETERIAITCVESTLKDELYDDAKVAEWVDTICEKIVKELGELRKPLKYIGMCTCKESLWLISEPQLVA
ncbi:hypothetical protein ABG067_004981, partial [Albugo candida]